MLKFKKIIATSLTVLALSVVALPATLLTTSQTAYAQTYHKGALLSFSIKKTTTNGWYTSANFDQTLTRTFYGYSYTYHLTSVKYSSSGKYHTTTAYYSID